VAQEQVERRLAAILAADMVGYSRLMEADEAGTIARQKAHRAELIDPKIDEHHGRIVKTTGDGMLVEFASVVDAVACTVAIQRAMVEREADVPEEQRIQYRVGVNLGDIVIDDDDILGDGVNVAARLEGLAEPGGICIPRKVFHEVRNKLDVGYEFIGEQRVKNIETPIPVYRVLLEPDLAGKVIGENRLKPSLWPLGAAVAAVIPDVEPASVEDMAFPLPDRPSIAVLPFDNLSGNTDQDYLADGLTEEIITTLSKSPNLFVIARNSTFTYKDKAVEVKQVAEEQGVRYVLEGSIQRSGVRIRVNIQLIDALVGRHVWAEIYDRQFGDIFALQDDITQNILIALEVELTQGEEVRLMHLRAPKPEAFVYLQKSRAHYYRFNSKDNAIARELAMKAVEISPEYPDAWEWLGWYDFNDYRFAWSADPNKSFKLAEEAANKAFVLDATVAGANGLLGALSLYRGEYEEAISHYRKAVELAPSNAIMTAGLGWVLCYGGYPEEAIPVLQQAMRLSPYYPAWMVGTLGLAFMMTGDYPKAIVATEQLIERKSLLQFGYSRLAAIHAALGDDEKAKTYAAELLKIKPDFSIAKWSKVLIYKDKELLDWELNALRSAGLPE
jgi:TolB-like protein/class 3 adenylate cyclase